MNRVNSEAKCLIELYCEIELRSGEDDEPIITKTFPKQYPDGGILKMIPSFAYPFKSSRVEK